MKLGVKKLKLKKMKKEECETGRAIKLVCLRCNIILQNLDKSEDNECFAPDFCKSYTAARDSYTDLM